MRKLVQTFYIKKKKVKKSMVVVVRAIPTQNLPVLRNLVVFHKPHGGEIVEAKALWSLLLPAESLQSL